MWKFVSTRLRSRDSTNGNEWSRSNPVRATGGCRDVAEESGRVKGTEDKNVNHPGEEYERRFEFARDVTAG